MQFKYTTSAGTYTHDANEAAFTVNENAIIGDSGRVKGVTRRWTIEGMLVATDHATLKTDIAALRAAYEVHRGDLVLLSPDSSTAESLLDSGSIRGTRVVSLTFPESGKGTAEYSNYRNYVLAVEASYITDGNLLLSFSETIRTVGGGPKIVWPAVIRGKSEPQTTQEFTNFKVIQSGSATQLGSFPSAPRAKWPSKQHSEQDQIAQFISGSKTDGEQEHTTTWSYSFESANSLA